MMNIELPLRRYAPALVLLAAIAVYLNSLANGFAYDDVFIIEQNARVHQLRDLRSILLTPYWPNFGQELGLYRPFAILLYAVQWAIGGGAAWVFHAGSVLLHAMASLLVFLLLRRLTGDVPALVGGLVFAVHPVHTEAVANVVGQAEIVAAIAVLAGCMVHVTRPPGLHVSWSHRAALVVLFGIGIATKESAVVLPALLVTLDLVQRRVTLTWRGLAAYVNAMAVPVFLLAATLAVYLVARYEALNGTLLGIDAGPSLPFLREEHRVLNALRAFPEFIRLLFLPLDLSADYSPGVILPVESLTGLALLGALLLAGLTLLMLATPWLPAAGLPAAWFLITLSPVANLFFPIGVLVAERTLYLPSVALSLLAATAWRAASPRASPAMRRLAPVALAAAVLLMGVRSWIRNPDWKSTMSVLASLERDHPESYRVQWARAEVMEKAGRTADAEYHFALAYRVHPRESQFLLDYGRYMMRTDRPAQGVQLIEEAYQLHPFVARTKAVLAHAYLVVGRYDDALRMVDRLEEHNVPRSVAMPLRAYGYHGLGRHDRAVAAWRSLQREVRGDSAIINAFVARSLAIAGLTADASTLAAHAAATAPDHDTAQRFLHLRAAIDDGCFAGFAPARESDAPSNATPRVLDRMPACDVLGDWFLATGQAQVATLLHNAIERSRSEPPTRAGGDP